MRRVDVEHLEVGDHIRLKYNLGAGPVVAIAQSVEEGGPGGNYPMFQYTNVIGDDVWCTYLVISSYTQPLRSAT